METFIRECNLLPYILRSRCCCLWRKRCPPDEGVRALASCRFGAAGKPSVSISGGPSAAPQRQHAAPAAASGLPKEAKQAVRESARNVALRPKDVQPGQSKGPGKKKVQPGLLDQSGQSRPWHC